MNARRLFRTAIWRVKDTLRHSAALRGLNAARLLVRAIFAKDSAKTAVLLSRALGFSESPTLDQWITSCLKKRFTPEGNSDVWGRVVAGLPRYRHLLVSDPALTRSIILKAPAAGGEKGVMLMYFEYNWAGLICGLSESDFEWINQHYDLILSTSWSPTDYAVLAHYLSKTSGPIFVQPCNRREMDKLRRFHPRVAVLDSLPCDWINPTYYQKEITARPIDFLMVANWGEFKRHWDFFVALRQLPASLRVVLVGQKEGGRDADFIRQLASDLGVPQQLEIRQSISIGEVAELQVKAKVSLIFSRREGCCVAAVESLFAGCALGMRDDAHVGPLDYINERTGLRLRPKHLSEDLKTLLELSETLDPASWARDNISCFITPGKLNRQLAESARERGLPWTRDLAVPHWRPYPQYVNGEDADNLRPVYEDLQTRFPRVFPEFCTLLPK